MTTRPLAALAVALVLPAAASEPPPRPAVPMPFRVASPLPHVSAACELGDGRVLVSDMRTPAVWLVDSSTGARTALGASGVGPEQWIQPGGCYGGPDGTLLLLDRAQARVMVVDAAGRFARTYSIAVRGTQMASDADTDLQRLDAAGLAYFPDRSAAFARGARGESLTSIPLLRFDPARQQRTPVAELALPETRVVNRGNGLVVSRAVIGSPADGWGVAPDGRVAIVRGAPYRVEWIELDGRATTGPAIVHDPIPITDADRAAVMAAETAGPTVGVQSSGSSGGGRGLSGLEPEFAATKAPFNPADVVVSPDAQVWVLRSRPAASTTDIYDVFDARGERIDRLSFPAGSRIMGFGRRAVFVRRDGPDGTSTLEKYARR
jgi:hypothetical protein